jgi:hypothetical protein
MMDAENIGFSHAAALHGCQRICSPPAPKLVFCPIDGLQNVEFSFGHTAFTSRPVGLPSSAQHLGKSNK